jgi:hypothetical protein
VVESIESGIEQAVQREEADRLRALGYERARLFNWSDAADATIETYRRAMM